MGDSKKTLKITLKIPRKTPIADPLPTPSQSFVGPDGLLHERSTLTSSEKLESNGTQSPRSNSPPRFKKKKIMVGLPKQPTSDSLTHSMHSPSPGLPQRPNTEQTKYPAVSNSPKTLIVKSLSYHKNPHPSKPSPSQPSTTFLKVNPPKPVPRPPAAPGLSGSTQQFPIPPKDLPAPRPPAPRPPAPRPPAVPTASPSPAPRPPAAPASIGGNLSGGQQISSESKFQPSTAGRPRGQEKRKREAPAPGLPRPPTKDVFTILVKLQKKDKHGIFAEPVTEELAPDYFEYVKHPMDFSTIRKKNANGEYSTWVEVKADVDQMYKNAMIYNLPDNFIHKLAEGFTKNAMASFKTVLAKEEVLRQSSADAKKSKHKDLNDADNGSFKSEEQYPPPSMLYNNNPRTPRASSNYSLGASSVLAGGEPSSSNRTLAEMHRTASGMADATPFRSIAPAPAFLSTSAIPNYKRPPEMQRRASYRTRVFADSSYLALAKTKGYVRPEVVVSPAFGSNRTEAYMRSLDHFGRPLNGWMKERIRELVKPFKSDPIASLPPQAPRPQTSPAPSYGTSASGHHQVTYSAPAPAMSYLHTPVHNMGPAAVLQSMMPPPPHNPFHVPSKISLQATHLDGPPSFHPPHLPYLQADPMSAPLQRADSMSPSCPPYPMMPGALPMGYANGSPASTSAAANAYLGYRQPPLPANHPLAFWFPEGLPAQLLSGTPQPQTLTQTVTLLGRVASSALATLVHHQGRVDKARATGQPQASVSTPAPPFPIASTPSPAPSAAAASLAPSSPAPSSPAPSAAGGNAPHTDPYPAPTGDAESMDIDSVAGAEQSESSREPLVPVGNAVRPEDAPSDPSRFS